MSKLHYVGPRVEISNHGIFYKKSKEDKYIYLNAAFKILQNIDNDYEKKPSYNYLFSSKTLEKEYLHTILKHPKDDIKEYITKECEKYKQKIQHQIEYVKNLPHLTKIDKEVWIKNIEIMKEYKMQRAINKMYYMHCIEDIREVIRHKKIKIITVPFDKHFFHVLNTVKGALIMGNPSLDAKVIEEYNKNNTMIVKLTIRN